MSTVKPAKTNTQISFTTELFAIGDWTILLLPEAESAKLPTRGQTMVEGTVNGMQVTTPLEPDGRWSHWLRIDTALGKAIQAKAGDIVTVMFEPVKTWPEPDVPADIQKALASHPDVHDLWQRITPLARWEWIRWIRSTSRDETRKHRIEVACSKLHKGMRRPCCWNRNACTEPAVSKNGVLLTPAGSDKSKS